MMVIVDESAMLLRNNNTYCVLVGCDAPVYCESREVLELICEALNNKPRTVKEIQDRTYFGYLDKTGVCAKCGNRKCICPTSSASGEYG